MNIDNKAQDQAVKDLQLTGNRKRNNMHQVFFNDLRLIEGYNERIIYKGIDELCEEIFMGGKNTAKEGLKNPLKGVFKNDKFYITIGHRRYKAFQLAIEKGYIIGEIPCTVEKKGYLNDKVQMTIDLIASNSGHQFNLVELGRVAKRLKDLGLKLSPQKPESEFESKEAYLEAAQKHIPYRLNKSHVQLYDAIIMADLTTAVTDLIYLDGVLGESTVRTMLKAHKKANKGVDYVKFEVEVLQAVKTIQENATSETVEGEETKKPKKITAKAIKESQNGGAATDEKTDDTLVRMKVLLKETKQINNNATMLLKMFNEYLEGTRTLESMVALMK